MTQFFAYLCFGIAGLLSVYVAVSVAVMSWKRFVGKDRTVPHFVSSVLQSDAEAAEYLKDASRQSVRREDMRRARERDGGIS